ncbi:intermembrane lipid transfer protein Vps13D-like [Daphnia carinata]|uniref:intermembrane lipid transfer protein Vps13D-like n=1 Tax=Daphnia carinata TaxID=120202 RepID=UPI00257CC05E|nr:intermembrane lipid transfer protein Vps13D-like [Daphnia carinata]
MLTSLVVRFCNAYLGQYLENLDKNQLSFSLLKGKAELQNLSIKKTAFENLNLPFCIHGGFVGKICIDIPLTRISSQPWVISFDQIYVIAGPKTNTMPHKTQKEKNEDLESHQFKRAALDLMEAEWKSDLGFHGLALMLYNSTCSSWISHLTSLVTHIVQNIELKMTKVHIRFEDGGISCPGKVIACGLHLKSFTAQTCDEKRKTSEFLYYNPEFMYKLLELNGLAVYWDTDANAFWDLPLSDLCKKMKCCSMKQDAFILTPTHGYAYIKRNRTTTSLQSLEQPRVKCDFVLDQVDIEFRDAQYYQCCKVLEMLSRRSNHKFNPRRQWKYAGERIIAAIHERKKIENWPFLIRRVQDVLLYVRSYKEHLMNSSAAAKFELERERIESEFELEELMMLRSIVMRQISRSRNIFNCWYDDFMTWWYAEGNWMYAANNESVINNTTDHEILEMLQEARKDNLIRKEDLLPIQFSFALKHGCFRLSVCPKSIETYQPSNLLVKLELREILVDVWKAHPKIGWIKLHVIVKNVSLCDRITKFFQSSANPEDEAPHFDFEYEKYPPDGDWKHRLMVTIMPTECVYKHEIVGQIRKCFPIPKKERSLLGQRVHKEIRSRLNLVKSKVTKILKMTVAKLSNNEAWDLKINVGTLRILIADCPFSPVPLTIEFGPIYVKPTISCTVADLTSLSTDNTVGEP